jgi:hypothetical protein
MDLVQRYVQSVRSLLPRAQQDDIAAELEDVIRARIEEREGELGRRLKDPEIEAILKTFGHPIAAAGRYAPQRHLIGPELFPFWWIAAKIAAVIAAVAAVARGLAHIAVDKSHDIVGAFAMTWETFWSTGLFLIGLITVIGAVMEHYRVTPFANWRVKDLGAFNVGSAWPPAAASATASASVASPPPSVATVTAPGGSWNTPRGRRRFKSTANAGANFFFSLIGVAIWAFAPLYIDVLPSWMNPLWWMSLWGVSFTPAEGWTLWGLIFAQAAAQSAIYLVDLVRPSSVRLRALASGLTSGLAAGVALYALKAMHLLYLDIPSRAEFHAMSTSSRIELMVQLTLFLIAIVSALSVTGDLYRFISGQDWRPWKHEEA